MNKTSFRHIALSALLLGSALAQIYLAGISWEYIPTRGGGAAFVVLGALGLVSLLAAVWQYGLAAGIWKTAISREVNLLSVVLFLQILPISLAGGFWAAPGLVVLVALLLGLLPHSLYLKFGQ